MTTLIRSIATSALFLVLTCVIYANQEAVNLNDIQISFKLDPRLTRSQYTGDIWISRPTYTGTSGQETIEAKAEGVDAKGRRISITPEWIPSDPDMVTVTTRQGKDVKLTIHRAGESKLKVTSMGFSKELVIKAHYTNNVIQVAISGGSNPPAAQTPP